MNSHLNLPKLGALALSVTLAAAAAAQTPAPPAPPAMYAMAALPEMTPRSPLAPLAPIAPPAPPEYYPGQGAPEGYAGQNADAPKDDLFAGTEVFAKNATDVTEINMDPQSLGMVGGHDAARAHRMVLNVVRTYTYDKAGMYDMAEVDKFRAKLNSGDWSCSVHTREMKTGQSTDVCSRHRTDGMKETAIITVEPKELTFIHTIRRTDDGSSDLGAPGMAAVDGLPMMAALDAGQLARMDAQMMRMQATLPAMTADRLKVNEMVAEQMRAIDFGVYRQRFEQMQERFNSPELKQRMDEMQQKLRQQLNSPAFKQQMQDLENQVSKSLSRREE